MIEIVNTSNQEVDLSTYYLSDSGNYFRLPVQASVDCRRFRSADDAIDDGR